jgi:hypothetical protein
VNATLDAALHWLSLGINTIPCYRGSKYLKRGTRLADYDKLANLPEVCRAFEGDCNIAVYPSYSEVTGKYLVVLDFDSLYRLEIETLETDTRRGKHYYFWSIESPEGLESDLCEVKYRRAVMIPPSRLDDFEYTDNGQEIMIIERLQDMIQVSPSKKEKPAIHIHINGNQNKVTVNVASFFTRRTNSIIADIKAHYPITSLFPNFYPSNDNMAIAHCPTSAHENGDRNPSLSLDLQSNRFHCFKPSCPLSLSRGGDVIDAYRILNRLSFKQSLAAMASELGL